MVSDGNKLHLKGEFTHVEWNQRELQYEVQVEAWEDMPPTEMFDQQLPTYGCRIRLRR